MEQNRMDNGMENRTMELKQMLSDPAEVLSRGIMVFHAQDEKDYSASGWAWHYGDAVFAGVLERAYLRVEPQKLSAFVASALEQLDERGLVNLYPGEQMPSDACVGIVYQPSYAVVALAMHLRLTLGEAETAWMNEKLMRLTDAAFRRGIAGHGFEAGDMYRKTMMMFGRAGLKAYLAAGSVLSEVFRAYMTDQIETIRQAVAEGNWRYAAGTLSGCPTLAAVSAALDGNDHPVFVYGTLMRGQRAAQHLETATFSGPALLADHAMYDLGSFPGIAPKQGETVLGELWFVDDATLARLDQYEGAGTLYRRETVRVTLHGEQTEANAYLYLRETGGQPVRTRWGMQDSDPVWYACYGSNLSARRFACYILGGILPETGREYAGCSDRTVWREDRVRVFPGRMYFGNESRQWQGGVSFFRPGRSGETLMRLYRITYGQLKEIRQQEGASDAWYGRLVCLGYEDDVPVFTLTSEEPRPENAPGDAYLALIRSALIGECGVCEQHADRYLKGCLRKPAARRRRK